ncbi:uncharacterized protein BDV14DRAFT_123233 [Aspergillus stella-maris]|uniref:uncharacterized protein n=1 Tax=Aspergillus stella-maris TaxID=1810926 RepID=UPI003CCD3CA7
MNDLSNPGSAALAPQPSRLPLRVRRSAVACRTCRRRKIRCDVTVSGYPCTNCRLDNDHCVVVGPKRPQNTKPAKRRREPGLSVQKPSAGLSSAPPLPDIDLPVELCQNVYPPVLSTELNWLPPQDVAYLNSQQALALPRKAIIHTLLQYYFLHFHPCFPVVRESEFRESTAYSKPFSLLVFRAMLFAATQHTPVECALDAGYNSISHLRFALYRSAKSLYDLGTERDPFHIAQAALLLADHFDYLDPLVNTTWITIAVENVRRASTHRSQMLEIYQIRKYRLSDLKRLWWCCLLRDRITSLASRRPPVLTLDQFDPRSADELSIAEVWDDDCEAFDSSMRNVLYQALMGQCRLATLLTPHTLSTNPSLGGIGPNVCVEKEKAAAMNTIRSLSSWINEYKELLGNRETRTNLAVAVNLHLTTIYYIGAHFILLNRLIILYLFRCRCSYDIDEAAGYEQYLGRLVLLVSQINAEVEWFATNKVLYFLPISIRCIVLLPHAFNVLWADRYGLESNLEDANDILIHYAKLDEDYSIRFGLAKLSHTVFGMMNLLMANHDASLIASVKFQDMNSLTPAQCLCFSKIGVHLSVVLDYGFSTGAAHQITPDIISSLHRHIFSRTSAINNCSGASEFRCACSASLSSSSAKSHTSGASPSGTQSSGATPSSSGEPYHSLSPPVCLLTPSTDLTGASWQKENQDSGSTSLERFNTATNVSQQSMQEWASELEVFMGPLFGL